MFETIRSPERPPSHPLAAPLWAVAFFVMLNTLVSVLDLYLQESRIAAVQEAFQANAPALKAASDEIQKQGAELQRIGEQLQQR